MGAFDSLRTADDRSLHVDRSFFRRCSFSLPHRSRTGHALKANGDGTSRRRALLPPVSLAVRVRTPAYQWLAGRLLRLVSGNRPALQSAPVAPHRALHHPRGPLCAAHTRPFAPCPNYLVCPDRIFRGVDLSTSCVGCRRRLRPRRLLPLFLSGNAMAPAGRSQSPRRLSLSDWRIHCGIARCSLLAFGRFPDLAGNVVCNRGCRLFRIGSRNFPKTRWPVALDCVVGPWSGLVRPGTVPALLSAAMSRLG